MQLLVVLLIQFVVGQENQENPYRGIPQDQIQKIQQSSEIVCDEGTRRLPVQFINDEYCDCLDGSDEPGTSACSNTNVQFFCENIHHQSKWISTSLVNDGICDCCDGSDENGSNLKKIRCENTCVQDAKRFQHETQESRRVFQSGYKIRQETIQNNQQQLEKAKDSIETKRNEIKSLQNALEIALKAKEDEETLENQERYIMLKDIMTQAYQRVGIAELSIDQLQHLILDLAQEIHPKKKVLELIERQRRLNELGPSIIQQEQTEFQNKKVKQMEAENQIRTLEEQLEDVSERGESTDALEAQIQELEQVVEGNFVSPIDQVFQSIKGDEYKRDAAETTRQDYFNAERALKDTQTALTSLEADLETDFGPKNVFYALKNECVSTRSGAYTYEICFFGQAKQDGVKLGYVGWTSQLCRI